MTLSRRSFVKTLFAATAQATLTGPLLTRGLFATDTYPSGLNFLVFGDWGREGQKDQLDVAAQMGVAAAQIGARFIISVGDNFYDYGVASVEDHQWSNSFEKVYTHPSLHVPWNVVLGNHDYRGNCQAQIDYGKGHGRWNMPSRYFSIGTQIPGGSLVDMIYIDTSPFVLAYANDARMGQEIKSQHTEKQINWIDSQLTNSKAPWKIVIGHHTIYSGGEHGDTTELISRLLPVLQKHNVQAYLNGHDHDLQHLQAGNLNMFCSGAGSTVRPTRMTSRSAFAKSQPGFMAVSLKTSAMDIRMIDGAGRVVYSATIPQKPQAI